MAEFPIVPAKTAMLFFDTLNVYLHPSDPKAQAELDKSGVVARMQKMMAACRAAGIPIFYAQADHRPDGKDFAPQIVDEDYYSKPGDAKGRVTALAAVGHAGPAREIISELAPRPEDYIIKKHRWSTFYQTHFELSLRTAGRDTIIICGGSLEIGVASTAYSARDRDFNQIILSDACTSGKPDVYDLLMKRVFPVFCRVMTVDEAIARFQK